MVDPDSVQIYLYVTLATVFLLFSDDLITGLQLTVIQSKILFMNANLFVRSYLIYRKLSVEFKRIGLPPPPFKFIKIQDRD